MFYVLIGLAIGLLILGVMMSEKWHCYEGWGFILALISGLFLFVMAIVWPVNYFTSKSFVVATYPTLVSTIENARTEDMSELERAALTTKILDVNGEIARMQYWSQTMWSPTYHNEIMELKPLK